MVMIMVMPTPEDLRQIRGPQHSAHGLVQFKACRLCRRPGACPALNLGLGVKLTFWIKNGNFGWSVCTFWKAWSESALILFFLMMCVWYGYRCPAKGGAAGSTSQATTGRAICGLWHAVCGMWSVAWSLTLDDRNMLMMFVMLMMTMMMNVDDDYE